MDSLEHVENELSKEEIHSALERLRHRKKKFEGLYNMLKEENEISTVDPDSRLMHQNGNGQTLDVCYNETAVDVKNSEVVEFDVNNQADDEGNLLSVSN